MCHVLEMYQRIWNVRKQWKQRKKKVCDFIHKPTFLHYKGKRYAYQEFINCTLFISTCTRNSQKLQIPLLESGSGQRSFYYRTVKIWNMLDPSLKLRRTLQEFKRKLKNFLLKDFMDSTTWLNHVIYYRLDYTASVDSSYSLFYFMFSLLYQICCHLAKTAGYWPIFGRLLSSHFNVKFGKKLIIRKRSNKNNCETSASNVWVEIKAHFRSFEHVYLSRRVMERLRHFQRTGSSKKPASNNEKIPHK